MTVFEPARGAAALRLDAFGRVELFDYFGLHAPGQRGVTAMLFPKSRRHQQEAQRVLVRFLNGKDIAAAKVTEDRRTESRTHFSVGNWVYPLSGKSPNVDQPFPAVTKDLSSTGIALIVNEPISTDEILLHLPTDVAPSLLRAKVCSSRSIGAGFHLLATEVVELMTAQDYPQLCGVEPQGSAKASP